MAETEPAKTRPSAQRWNHWPAFAFERLRMPYGLILAAFLVFSAISLFLESSLKYRAVGQWGSAEAWGLKQGIATAAASLFILAYMRIIKQAAITTLAQLRSIVQVDDPRYESFARRLIWADSRVEFGLLLVAAFLAAILLVLPDNQLRSLPHSRPLDILALAWVTVFYMLAFWLMLSLVYNAIRNARALAQLAAEPLQINVFDPAHLLPFGRFSLVQSLAFVGVFLIPLILLGSPRAGGWLVILLSLLSLMALFVPLWGVHRQIIAAREQALNQISEELMAVQHALVGGAVADAEKLAALAQHTTTLIEFRRRVLNNPSWPFRDVGAVLRASAAALGPLVYFILNYLVQSYIFPLFRTP